MTRNIVLSFRLFGDNYYDLKLQ